MKSKSVFLFVAFFVLEIWMCSCARSQEVIYEPNQYETGSLEKLREKGSDARICIFPVNVGSADNWTQGIQLACFLERSGATSIDVVREVFFAFRRGAGCKTSIEQLESYLENHELPGGADFYLFSRLHGSSNVGITGIEVILVDSARTMIWARSFTREDTLFNTIEPYYPMDGMFIIARQMTLELGWEDVLADDFHKGKWWNEYGKRFAGRLTEIKNKLDRRIQNK